MEVKNCAELFECVLDDGEKIIKTYRPVRKTIRQRWWFWLYIVPLFWPALIITWPIMFPIYRAWLNKRAYACTNKRIIVRGGIIGIDYKFLDYKEVKATIIKVGFFDKVAGKNTGTLEFGSMAAPLGATNSNGLRTNPFIFFAIESPHDELKKIKTLIDKGE